MNLATWADFSHRCKLLLVSEATEHFKLALGTILLSQQPVNRATWRVLTFDQLGI